MRDVKKYTALKINTIIFISISATFLFFKWIFQFTYGEAISEIQYNLFPLPHVNGFYGTNIAVYVMVYFSIILSLIFTKAFSNPLMRSSSSNNIHQENNFLHVIIFYLIMIAIFQGIGHAHYFIRQHDQYRGKMDLERKSLMFGFPFEFVTQCKQLLSDRHTFRIITDMDTAKSKGMTVHRILTYFFYPSLSEVGADGPDPDYLVFFHKLNAAQSIPVEYRIKYQYDASNLFVEREGQ